MKNQLVNLFAGLVWAATAVMGQAPAAAPAKAPLQFDVATIRAAPSLDALRTQILQGKIHVGMKIDQQRVDFGFLTINDLLPIAFKVKPYQVQGPESMKSDRWDILATLPAGASTDDVPVMLQGLLQDRFKLTYHHDKKDQNVYVLTVDKGGAKLQPADPDADKPPADDPKAQKIDTGAGVVSINQANGTVSMTGGPQGPMRIMLPSKADAGPLHLEFLKTTVGALVDLITPMMDKPLVDQTGLTGTYHVTLDLPIDQLMAMVQKQAAALGLPVGGVGGPGGGANAALAASDPSGSSLTKALQQLGLRMESKKAPIDLIVVDHVEKTPTEN